MKALLTIILSFITFIALGQNVTTIKVSVPDKSDEVYIVGNQDALGNWDPQKVKMNRVSDYEREIEVELTYPAEFKFTKGSWTSEGIVTSYPNNPNLTITDPEADKSFVVKTWLDNLDSDKLGLEYDLKFIESEWLGDKRMIKVYVPQGYTPEKTYPVIYMTDGGTDNFEVAKGYMNALTPSSFNYIPPSILVGIVHKERNYELYGIKSGKNFTQYVFDEVVPLIDSNYSTSGFNAMIGHSNGAEYNHNIMLMEDNPFRGFISLSTSFAGMGNKEDELTTFFQNYDGKNIYFFLANGTMDSPDRTEFGNTIANLFENNPNPNIAFVKNTYEADHLTVVPEALLDGLKYIFRDYSDMDAYPTIFDYSDNFLTNVKVNYGIEGSYKFDDLNKYFSDIISNKKKDDYEYLISFIEKHKMWQGGGFDPVNIANHYYMMELYPETIASYNQAIEEFKTVEQVVYYANILKAINSYTFENRFADVIPFLEKSRNTLSREFYLEMTYHIAKFSIENNVSLDKGKQALDYCMNNFRKNKTFTKNDLVALDTSSVNAPEMGK